MLSTKNKTNNSNRGKSTKSNKPNDKRKRKRTPASEAVYNTAYTVVSFESVGEQIVKDFEAKWFGALSWPLVGYDNARLGPFESVGDLVIDVSNRVKDFMRVKKYEYIELIFKMPHGGPHKMFLYYKDIEKADKIIQDQRDPDYNAYD